MSGEQKDSLADELFKNVDRLGPLENKIISYSGLRTNEEVEPKDEFSLPKGADFRSGVKLKAMIVVPEGGEIILPSLDEMKNDFSELAVLVDEKQATGMVTPNTLWGPVVQLTEKFLSSNVAPDDSKTRLEVFLPLYKVFIKHEGVLIQPDVAIIGGSVKQWLEGIDPGVAEELNKTEVEKS